MYSSEETPVKRKRLSGRPAEEVRKVAFEKTMKFFEQNDDEQITIGKLVTEMSKYCGEPYSVVYMRQMLKARYGDNIIVTSINGKTDVVTFRYTARYILHEFFEDSKSKCDDDKDGIIKAAANIIRSDIKSLAVSKQVYPLASHVQDTKYNKDYLPRSVQLLLRTIFTEKKADLKLLL